MMSVEEILAPISSDFARYEKLYDSLSLSPDGMLGDVMSYVLSTHGKRMRVLLTLLSSKISGEVNEKSIMTALIMELMHTASLIHDDVVDGSDMRRGMPSVNAHWGNKVAVLSGDYLLSRVVELLSELRNVRILGIVSEMGKSLSEGELLELRWGKDRWLSEDEYFRMIEKKTACLFSSCCEAGAVSGGGSVRAVSALSSFGEYLGMCFQLQDDILDYSDSEELGKPVLGDIRDGKVTLPLIKSMERASVQERERIRFLLSGQSLTQMEEEEIRSFVLRFDGVGYTRRKMLEYRDMAIDCMCVFRDSELKRSLFGVLEYSINRLK